MDNSPRVLLLGEDVLAASISSALKGKAVCLPFLQQGDPRVDSAVALVIAVCDVPRLDELRALTTTYRQAGIRLLPVWAEFGEIFIGPLSLHGVPGCLNCLTSRRRNCSANHSVWHLTARESVRRTTGDLTLDAGQMDFVGGLVAAAALQALRDSPVAQPMVTIVELASLNVEQCLFLADPDCAICTSEPDAVLPVAPALDDEIFPPGQWRVRDVAPLLPALRSSLVNARTGFVTRLGIDLRTELCAMGTAHLRSGALAIETWTGGLTTSFDRSQCVAILEAMERYAGVAPHGKSKPQRASFVALKEPKLDPARMTLYSADQYESPSFPCVRYSPQLELDWVWGWSFGNRTAIRIPEQFVYYDATRPPPGGRIVIESSNGCASGGSLEEAVFYGALEALERDAAMRTWYAMASPRRIDLAAMLGSELQLAVDRFHWVTGFELHALDITQEFAVPTIWMLAVGKHDGGYASISATKCHPDPLTAISGACFEIFGAFHSFLREYANKRSRMLKLCNEPDLLEEQLDHVYLAALPEAFSHYSFLLDGPVVAIDDTVFGAEPGVQRPRTLSVLFESILRVARDIAVVDMTTPEQRPWGMHSARVIIPELLPLTIGQRMRRTENSPRLAGLSRLNPWPHPFP